jgi:hypothetical protein
LLLFVVNAVSFAALSRYSSQTPLFYWITCALGVLAAFRCVFSGENLCGRIIFLQNIITYSTFSKFEPIRGCKRNKKAKCLP